MEGGLEDCEYNLLMKSVFSKSWQRSRQPRKQIKFRSNAPNHIARKFMGSHLDKGLRDKYGIRSIEVRKGDEVKIMRGKFKGKVGKVGVVEVCRTRIQVDGVSRTKKGGEKVETWFHPSSVKIISLNVDDKMRMKRNKKMTGKDVAPKDNDVPLKGKVESNQKKTESKQMVTKKEDKKVKSKLKGASK
jgi:large subunit ribosomal protein L24